VQPTTTHELLCQGLTGNGEALHLTLDPAFQGLPSTAHGGSVLAAVDAAVDLSGPRCVTGVYRRRVPMATRLGLRLARDTGTVRFELTEGPTVLVDGDVSVDVEAKDAAAKAAPVLGTLALPVSATCFVCGTENVHGLRARPVCDDASVGIRWAPSSALRGPDGGLASIALTSLLDETAFWLGALATGEAGMTTQLRIVLHRSSSAGGVVVVTGRRADVAPVGGDARYWLTRVSARDEEGRLLATGEITFVAVRGAARRLVTGMLGANLPEVVRRVFPAYAG
jgi:acyl-coenzyme A thioesterase PaaI-like protein